MQKLELALGNLQKQIASQPATQEALKWYGAKTEQEKLILKLVAAFVAIMLVVALIIQPIIKSHTTAEKKLEKSTKLYQTLASNAGKFGGASSNSSQGQPILNVVTKAAKARGLTLKRFEPDGNKLKVWFENTPFDSTIGLIEELSVSNGILAEQINVERSDKSGRADIRATLTR